MSVYTYTYIFPNAITGLVAPIRSEWVLQKKRTEGAEEVAGEDEEKEGEEFV